MDWSILILILLIFIPLTGGIISALQKKAVAPIISCSSIGLGLIIAIFNVVLLHQPFYYNWQWVAGIPMGFGMDRLNAILILLVYFISLLVYVFSITYMEEDEGRNRFYLMLGFFVTSMIGLLTADQLVSFFIFWELVGLTSYLLIGFWYRDPARSASAKNAFMINRIADAFLLAGIIFTFTEDYPTAFSAIDSGHIGDLAACCFIIGAFGKSAQFPFFGWLTKAMAGPTPVSALIHAATMVTAGVYLLIRIAPALSAWSLGVIAVGGSMTALMGGIAALMQFDIKKVLAYSTISQLGFMVLGIGVGAYQASLFHLWTHAFFKAGLFLGAGAVIHYMHRLLKDMEMDPQDMRNMGGLHKILPATFYSFVICGLALSGLPFLSGFLSKEGILTGSYFYGMGTGNFLVPGFTFMAALITPVYIGRQIMLIFIRKGEFKERIAEPVLTVKIPLLILAIGSLWFWNSTNPINAGGWFWNQYLFAGLEETSSGVHTSSIITYVSIAMTLTGLGFIGWFYRPNATRVLTFDKTQSPSGWLENISFQGWYLERFYAIVDNTFVWWVRLAGAFDQKVIDRLVNALGITGVVLAQLAGWFDKWIVDGLVNLIANLSQLIGRIFTQIQAAEVQKQLTWLLLGILGIFLWFQFAS